MSLALPKCQWFFYLLRKGLIYLVQLPWVLFMEMSEKQSGEANSNKDDCCKGARTPHWHAALFFHSSGFPEIRQGADSGPKHSHAFCLRDSYIPEILKHITNIRNLSVNLSKQGNELSVLEEGVEELGCGTSFTTGCLMLSEHGGYPRAGYRL